MLFKYDILKIEYSGINCKGLTIEYSSLDSKRHLFTHYLTSISIKCISAFYVNCRSRLELVNANKVERTLTVELLEMALSHYACYYWLLALGSNPATQIMDIFARTEPTNYRWNKTSPLSSYYHMASTSRACLGQLGLLQEKRHRLGGLETTQIYFSQF